MGAFMTDYKSDEKYLRYKALGIVCGLISLFSFWIVLGFAVLVYPTGLLGENHYGSFGIALANIPTMFLLAIAGLVTSLFFRSRAKQIRLSSASSLHKTAGQSTDDGDAT
jgi:hypothetical protein